MGLLFQWRLESETMLMKIYEELTKKKSMLDSVTKVVVFGC